MKITSLNPKMYKLIKTYPGSPILGTEAIKSKISNNLYNLVGYGISHATIIENQQEYWQEIKKELKEELKDYEILSYKYENRIFKYTLNPPIIGVSGFRHYENNGGILDEYSMKDLIPSPTIHSVKRLSDGKVFTIGDSCLHKPTNTKFIINTIYFIDTQLVVNNYYLFNIEHIKEPLFTTFDNVDIYEGDEYYTIWKDLRSNFIMRYNADKTSGKDIHITYFSTKQAAENYIICNKPVLSLTETLNIINEQISKDSTAYFLIKKDLKKLIKSKL